VTKPEAQEILGFADEHMTIHPDDMDLFLDFIDSMTTDTDPRLEVLKAENKRLRDAVTDPVGSMSVIPALNFGDFLVYGLSGGHTMAQEYGLTHAGNPIAGRWVIRNPLGEIVVIDRYRHDALSHSGLKVEHEYLRADKIRSTQRRSA
jgi:hypothetical protein